jgi:hypothetical protein
MALRRELASVLSEMAEVARHISLSGGALIDRDKLMESRARRDALAGKLKESVEIIQRYGCLIKDLEKGLIDFPTSYRGREVYLCWKMGEDRIAWWHEVEDGFRGRRPIDREFLENHCGGSEDRPD